MNSHNGQQASNMTALVRVGPGSRITSHNAGSPCASEWRTVAPTSHWAPSGNERVKQQRTSDKPQRLVTDGHSDEVPKSHTR